MLSSAEAAVRAEARVVLRAVHAGYGAGAVGVAHGAGELLGFGLVLCGAVLPSLEQRGCCSLLLHGMGWSVMGR